MEQAKEKIIFILNVLFIKKTKNIFLQLFRYGLVGGIAAIVNIVTLFVFTDIFNGYYIISIVFGFILGLITNYCLSKIFVFSTENVIDRKKEFIAYAIIGVIGLGIDTFFMFIVTSIFNVYYLLSKIVSTIITFIWNFGARKLMYYMGEKRYGAK